MDFLRPIKKLFWKFSAIRAKNLYSLNDSLVYFGVTGTDGKTTTSSFLYEIAKAHGYKPLMITTVGARFEDEDIELDIKSTSFFAYSVKTAIQALKKLDFRKFFQNITFSDHKGFSGNAEQHRTTPLASEIRKTLIEFEKKGADFFIIETTSHSIDQYRVFGINFDSVVYTNITNEHLDYHGTWEKYAGTKAKLIDQLKTDGTVAINRDDTQSYEFLQQKIKNCNRNIKVIDYQVSKDSRLEDFDIKNFFTQIKNDSASIEFIATKSDESGHGIKTSVNIFGNYNIYNALAAFAGFYGFNSSNPQLISKGISNLKNVPGRMTFLNYSPDIIVDFAHTPNAMRKALESLNTAKKEGGRLWVVFGCAGLRDKYKRPEMGKISFDLADNILITSEDPRTENLHQINDEIISGFKNIDEEFVIHSYYPEFEYDRDEEKFVMRFDEPNPNSRKSAIKFAINNCAENDVVIILGKGHERSIAFGETEFEWNDISYVQAVLAELKRPAVPITSE